MRMAHVYDDERLKAELAREPDYRQTSLFNTVPIVAAFTSINEAANREGYIFRVASRAPRNSYHRPTAEEEGILKYMADSKTPEYFNVDSDAGEIVYARPIMLTNDCMSCHGDPATSASKDGKDILGFPMENWQAGDQHGMFVLRAKMDRVDGMVHEGLFADDVVVDSVGGLHRAGCLSPDHEDQQPPARADC